MDLETVPFVRVLLWIGVTMFFAAGAGGAGAWLIVLSLAALYVALCFYK